MIKELRIKETEDQKAYVMTDTHLGHYKNKAMDFVIRKRGYETKEEHDNDIIGTTNVIVRPNDILFHLGDFCLNTDESQFNEYLSRINCQNIYYIWGNHNNPIWTIYQREVKAKYGEEIEVYPFRYRNMVFMGSYLEAQINGIKFVMSHYPIYVFNEMKHGVNHLCGHSHYSLPLSTAENESSKILDCGWDGHQKPLSINDIMAIMDKKKILKVDHHQKGI